MPIDILHFRDETKGGGLEQIRASHAKRNGPPEVIDEIVALDVQWREMCFRLDNHRKNAKLMSKAIGQLIKGKKPAEEIAEAKARVATNAAELKALSVEIVEVEKQVKKKVASVGNYVHESVPTGVDEEKANRVEKTWGEPKPSTPELHHHHELLYMIGGYEPERGVKVAGHRGYFLTGVGCLLNQALIQYGLSFLCKKKYTPIQPPFMMKKDVMAETAQLSQFDEELYKVTGGDDEKYLIATSEQPISALHRGEWIPTTDCPLRYAGISTCFRKEAGSHGKDAWGIFRIHQFEKIEQFVLIDPESSWEEHNRMSAISEEFYQSLNLPYHVIAICAGALNNAAAKKLDLEAWFPTLGVYRELVSCSNCTDYQSRALEIRYGQNKKESQGKQYIHMLNSTLCATERTICCILENYQTPTGVTVPEVLRPFMGGIDFMPFVRAKLNTGQNKKKKN